jgi:hypothetical protein
MTLPPLGSERLLPSIAVAACHVASAGENGDVTTIGSTEAIEAWSRHAIKWCLGQPGGVGWPEVTRSEVLGMARGRNRRR